MNLTRYVDRSLSSTVKGTTPVGQVVVTPTQAACETTTVFVARLFGISRPSPEGGLTAPKNGYAFTPAVSFFCSFNREILRRAENAPRGSDTF